MRQKVLLVFFFIIHIGSYGLASGVAKIVSWNMCNFGKSKSRAEIALMADIIKNADIVAVQEVSVSIYGARAVAMLADELNRKGAKWDYAISDPTEGKGSERYAFLWKSSIAKLKGKPWLEKSLEALIDREPFMARFEISGRLYLLSTIHAVPKSKEPWRECRELYRLHLQYASDRWMIMLSQKNTAFDQLKANGVVPCLINVKTSIKMEIKKDQKFANEYDNIFYEKQEFDINACGIIDFTTLFPSLKEARMISDHTPVFVDFNVK